MERADRPNVKVENLVVLVNDSKNKRFGQIGRLAMHDRQEYGLYHVVFPDEEWGEFPDAVEKGSPKLLIKLFHRHSNETLAGYEGVDKFIQEYLEIGKGDIVKLRNDYETLFKEELNE